MLWDSLADLLAPFLLRVIGPALATNESLHLHVLAPGSLRLLPLTGLRAGARPLLEAFQSITHLPALRFDDPLPLAPSGRQTACLFANSASGEGMLAFGRATIATLRRAFSTQVIEPTHPNELQGRDIVEIYRIQSIAAELSCLRIYGQGSILSGSASDALVLLSHDRVLSGRNIMDPLPTCEVVELWAATAGAAASDYAACDREDRLPGLVAYFLQCGARGVIDVAWPVFDLVKALVCERYGLTKRRLDTSPSEGLTAAIVWAQRTLAAWREARAEHVGVRSALAWLDIARRAAVVSLGGNPDWVEPYVPLVDHTLVQTLSVDELLAEATQPCHFAAFRYWGGVPRRKSAEEDGSS